MTHRDHIEAQIKNRIAGIVRPGSGGAPTSSSGFGVPIGPSGPLRQVYPVISQVGPPTLSALRNTRDGRGVICPVGVAAPVPIDTPVTVTHNLGRLVRGVEAVQNNGGATTNPSFAIGTGTRTQQTITANREMINCFVRFY